MRIPVLYLVAATVLGCDSRPSSDPDGLATPADGALAPGELASSERLPDRYGFGRRVTPEEMARVDIDIMPDGRGLPPGSGTAAQGSGVYAAKCADCHGHQGEGTPAGSALVGRNPGDAFDFALSSEKERTKTIGNYCPHATTIFDYVRRAMPFDLPGSLTDEEVYAVTAYLLYRNEVVAEDAVMDARTLPLVQMPARHRFVLDTREESTRVR